MPKFRLSLVAGAVAAALSAGPAAAQFSNFYFFGDSLTDAGSYKPILPPGTGLFTTNPGPVWAQALGSRYGFTITPANQGGTDYAMGGARVTQTPGQPPVQPTASAMPIATQVQTQVGKGIDPSATYLLWGGPNDIAVQADAYLRGQITQAQLQANIATTATQFAQQAAVLQNAGAQYIVMLNLPDIGRTPYGASQGPAVAAQLSAISTFYNSTEQATLNAIGGNQVRVNIYSFLNEVLANPAAYGFTNTTGSACTNDIIFLCTSSTLVAPNAAQTYLYADGYHPTTAGHAAVAQLVASMLEGPAQMASLAEAPLAVEQAQFRALDGRMWSALDTPPTNKTLQSWVAYDYSAPDVGGNAFLSGDGSMNSVALGLDMRISPSVLVGVAFGYSQDKVDFGNGTGGFTLDETSMTFYGGWGSGPWYLGGSLLLGNLDYNDVHRNITLGTATRTENADTSGWHYAIRALGGYWFKSPNLIHGPFGKVVWQEASVNNFSETSSSSTSLSYAKQDRESLQTSLGWQLQGTWGSVRPFGRATWEYEAKADDRSVTASSVTLGGSYSVPAYKPDNNWGLFVLGASSDFGGVTGYLMGTATAGKGDGDAYSVTLGIRVPL